MGVAQPAGHCSSTGFTPSLAHQSRPLHSAKTVPLCSGKKCGFAPSPQNASSKLTTSHTSAKDPVVDFLRRQMWVVCTLALFFMAGGQVLHACVDTMCDVAQEQSSCPDQQDCPIGHCCHSHVCGSLVMIEHAEFFFMASPPVLLSVKSETCSDGPCREIDHPPQLS